MTTAFSRDRAEMTTSKTNAPGEVEKRTGEEDRENASAAGSEDIPGRERRKPFDGFSLGTPLTAAFVGGFLVIENVMGDGQESSEGEGPSPADNMLWQDGDGLDAALSSGAMADSGSVNLGTGGRGDVDVGASDSAALDGRAGGPGSADGSVMPGIAETSDAAVVQAASADGSPVSVNLLNINVSNGEVESEEIEPIVEDEVLSRKRTVGTPGDDVLIGTDGHDELVGASGNDVLHGLGGSDVLLGNEGDDQLFGGTGRDRLDGGAGNDILDGGQDTDLDLLRGGLGDDVIYVDGLHDVPLERDFGAYANDNDLVVIRQGYADQLPNGHDSATFVFADNLGAPLPEGASGYRQLLSAGVENAGSEGTANHDFFADGRDNQLFGNDGDNVIHAGGGDDRAFGGGGQDRIFGGDGDDELRGGSGNDVIDGGRGEDMLYGDAGNDTFVIGMNDTAIDTVFDHEGINSIRLDGVGDRQVDASLLGDDLYISVDQTPIARVESYVGHESAWSGIDFGQGVKSISSLLQERPDIADAVSEAEARAAEAAGDDLLALHQHLTEPTVLGARRASERLDGGEEDDWLSGFDGRDTLFGHAGNDILEGGDDSDDLRGGAGDDRYIFNAGERGIDTIRDTEGRNFAELKGYDRAKIEGAMFGDDLRVLADGDLLFSVEDYAQHADSFQGVQAGNRFIQTEDLFA